MHALFCKRLHGVCESNMNTLGLIHVVSLLEQYSHLPDLSGPSVGLPVCHSPFTWLATPRRVPHQRLLLLTAADLYPLQAHTSSERESGSS